jgi:hypothetical protein
MKDLSLFPEQMLQKENLAMPQALLQKQKQQLEAKMSVCSQQGGLHMSLYEVSSYFGQYLINIYCHSDYI